MRHASSAALPLEADVPRQMCPVDAAVDVVSLALAHPLKMATLLADEQTEIVARRVQEFMATIGVALDMRHLPATLARGGTVGRIGVPQPAVSLMLDQRVMLGRTHGGSPLAPVTRLWRGLQRRADVLLDVIQSTTFPGSNAAAAGNQRDVLLVAHRVHERAVRAAPGDAQSADQWMRARDAAEHVYRLASADGRPVMLVLPIGRVTLTQQLFTDALERHARLHRAPAPRTVKAGLLSALLCGESACARWLVASVMHIDELTALTTEAIGDTGPWPVMSIGRDATFYDLPAAESDGDGASALLLVMASLLHRNCQTDLAQTLLRAVQTTTAAAARMREELGTDFRVPTEAFLHGILANWGRSDSAEESRPRGAGNRGHGRVLNAPLRRDGVELLPDAL